MTSSLFYGIIVIFSQKPMKFTHLFLFLSLFFLCSCNEEKETKSTQVNEANSVKEPVSKHKKKIVSPQEVSQKLIIKSQDYIDAVKYMYKDTDESKFSKAENLHKKAKALYENGEYDKADKINNQVILLLKSYVR